jgi:hypothetical protein
LVPSGTFDQDNCGDAFSPTQFGLLGAFAVELAIFFGIILPSWNVLDLIEKGSACAALAAKPKASATAAVASRPYRFVVMTSPPRMCFYAVRAAV